MIINLVLFFIPKRQEIYRLYLIKKRKKLAYMRLNSKSKFYWAYDAKSKFIQIVFETNNSDHLYFDTYDIVQFRFNNKEIRCSARTYSTQNWSVIWTK